MGRWADGVADPGVYLIEFVLPVGPTPQVVVERLCYRTCANIASHKLHLIFKAKILLTKR